MTEKEYLAILSAFTPIGPMRIRLLYSYFKTAKKIWEASKSELLEVGLSENLSTKFIEHKNSFDPQKYFDKLKSFGVSFVTIFEKEYPKNLKEIDDAPYILYVRGNLKSSDSNSVAIVGTRMMTSYGCEIARKFASGLGDIGITVVSGLALGVDAEAQRSALNAGGRTIAVLASGLDIISPITNRQIALEIIAKKSGAVISEYPLGYTPHPYDFPVRDRLVSAMAKAIIVIEGRMKSGTFYTVKAALDQGKTVFAVPGQINSPTSEGPNYLIQNGAKLITSIKDVLDELHLQIRVDSEALEKVMPSGAMEEKIMEILETEPLHLDELVRITGSKTGEVSARLTIMEMKGMVVNLGGSEYRKA